MPKFNIIRPPLRAARKINFTDFIGVSKGLSITSAAASGEGSPGEDFLELGLSKTYNLRIEARGNELLVSLIPTINSDDFPPVRFEIIREGEVVTAELLESRLHHLRQLYALIFLLESGREDEVANLLKEQPSADIERSLVDEENKLIIREATPGSLIVTMVAASKKSYKAIISVCSLPFERGREAFLKSVEAKAELSQLEVRSKSLDINIKAANAIIDLEEKIGNIKNESTRDLLRSRLINDFDGMRVAESAHKTIERNHREMKLLKKDDN